MKALLNISRALVTALIFTLAVLLCSCYAENSRNISNAFINENGELILIYSDGNEDNLGVVVGEDGTNGLDGAKGENGADGAPGSIVITNDNENLSLACAKGLRSAVSIVCQFQATVQQGGWRPGSGSTTTKNYSSAGSGVIYSLDREEGDAFVITNYHVVYDASSNTENGISDDISIYLYGSEIENMSINASYVGGSLYYDIAVLRIEDSEILHNSDACAVSVADLNDLKVGDTAIAIGNAQGLGISSTSGIVSVDSEYITMTAADGKSEVSFRVMRVDTAINSGNSGGGLFNDQGELIGIVNAKIVYDGVENIGYAIPANVAVSITENIIHYCHGTNTESVQRPMLGITLTTSDSRAVYDSENGLIQIEQTVSVYEVTEGSLADGILCPNDIITSVTVNGSVIKITRQYHLIDLLLDLRVGDTVTVNLIRDGLEQYVSITVTEESLEEY